MQPAPEVGRGGLGDRARHGLLELVGRCEYWCRPDRDTWGGPFNGQEFRQRTFIELAAQLPLVGIVETGTDRGVTTRFFRYLTALPVHSFEVNPRRHGFARSRLRALPDLWLSCCDSRVGLRNLARSRALPSGCVFFYLDAHGCGDLPLGEEVDVVFSHWPEAVVMVDDFAVPDDPDYGFDDYGAGQRLTLAYLSSHRSLPKGIWFPACAASSETGARRGWVVMAESDDIIARIDGVPTLRRWRGARADVLTSETK